MRQNDPAPTHVLIVEDSDTQAMRLRLYLEANGWAVSRAASGQEAREMLFNLPEKNLVSGHAAQPIDMVVLDYNLPDTFGDVLCHELRLHEETRHLPVLMLTAAERQETELQTLQSGADDYVSKSVPIEVVIARLSALLQKARARAELSDRYERERRVAQVLQESLLFAPPANAFPGLSFQMIYEPAWDEARIGGDFYDIRALENGKVALVVGDVTGKGLEAATFMAEIKYALRAFLHEHPEPGVALERLNDFVCENAERNNWASSACVAIALAVFDTQSGEVRISAAGSEPPLLLQRGDTGSAKASEVTSNHGPLIGVIGGIPFATDSFALGSDDILMLFTDGITEARQRGGRMLGYEGMAEIAQETYSLPEATTDSVVTAVVAEAKRLSGGQLLDDACLLAVQRQQ